MFSMSLCNKRDMCGRIAHWNKELGSYVYTTNQR